MSTHFFNDFAFEFLYDLYIWARAKIIRARVNIPVIFQALTKIKVEYKHWEIETPCRSTKLELELSVTSSNYHIEITPSDVGTNDNYLIQTIIKDMARSNPIKTVSNGNHFRPFKVLVLFDVDRLSKEAQHSLRRTMEKYASVCRLIMCCKNFSRIIEPLCSRCLSIRVPALTQQDICEILKEINQNENLIFSKILVEKVSKTSDRNLRKAICLLETYKTQKLQLYDDTLV